MSQGGQRRQRVFLAVGGAVILIAALLAIIAAVSRAKPAGSSTTSGTPQAPPRAAKILVEAEGLVEVKLSDLQALGWNDADLPHLRVSYAGREAPVWIDGNALRFYATISPTRYMSETVYWIERGDQAVTPMIEKPLSTTAAAGAVDHYTATAHAEENHVYSPQVKEGDHWFWVQLAAPTAQTFTVTLSAVARGPAQMQIELWASTEGPANPDHHYRLSINDQRIGDFSWDGLGRHTISADVPADVLHDGGNRVLVEAPGDTGVAADTTYIDWIEMQYPRRFVAENDRLVFESAGGPYQLSGFSGPIDLFDVTRPDLITRSKVDFTGTFQGETARRYWAVGPRGYRSARLTPARLIPDLRADSTGADYIAIGPDDLLEPLKPLLDWRAAQGRRVMAVPVDAIYDQFGAGRVDPEAIRSFLQHARQTWSAKPKYVLLVGGASYDTLGYTVPPSVNRLPTFLVQTVFGGETASDVLFAQFDGDPLPELAIGRVPAREVQQVRQFVEKTLAYEQHAPAGDWRRRVLAVADGQAESFKTAAQNFLDQFSPDFLPELLDPPAGAVDANRNVIHDMNEGDLIVGYFGHGSITQWSQDNLLTAKDAAALQNGMRLPLVINMTCLTGLFIHPKVQSLAETLLWQPSGGAVAVLAPTSLTLAEDQSFLSRPLVEYLMQNRDAALGDILLQAQRAVPVHDAGSQDVLRTFLLFGDPALRLAKP